MDLARNTMPSNSPRRIATNAVVTTTAAITDSETRIGLAADTRVGNELAADVESGILGSRGRAGGEVRC